MRFLNSEKHKNHAQRKKGYVFYFMGNPVK